MEQDTKFLVRVDQFGNWTGDKYREVTRDELDKILEKYSQRLMELVSGPRGAMAMWACFKNAASTGCYADAINAYRMLTDDTCSLEEREHELRHFWNQYNELKKIRRYGTMEAYYLAMAEEAKNRQANILKPKGDKHD